MKISKIELDLKQQLPGVVVGALGTILLDVTPAGNIYQAGRAAITHEWPTELVCIAQHEDGHTFKHVFANYHEVVEFDPKKNETDRTVRYVSTRDKNIDLFYDRDRFFEPIKSAQLDVLDSGKKNLIWAIATGHAR